jgi:hypothetical protein
MGDDLEIWEKSSNISDVQDPASRWLFDKEKNALFILKTPKTIERTVTRRCLLDLALLDLHDFHWGNNSGHVHASKISAQLRIYHSYLRSLAEKDLLGDNSSPVSTPEVMKSWVQRTLYLYGHHAEGRRDYAKDKVPDISGNESEDPPTFHHQ